MQMLNDDEVRDIEKGFNAIRLMWIMLVIALAVFIIIANVIGKEGTITGNNKPDEAFLLIGYILYAIGAIILIVVYFIRRIITNQKSVISRMAAFMSTAGGSTIMTSGGNPRSAVGRYLVGILICSALIEAIGIYGLIIFIIDADFLSLYFLIGVAAAAHLYFRPKKQELIDLATQIKQNS
jgi:F0F1-type ATP synthase membrane subunit c/vacuolar-type H+-ATPase subunit K